MQKNIEKKRQDLAQHQAQIEKLSLRRLFEDDEKRADRFSCELDGLYLDFSKNHLTSETMNLLRDYADACGLPNAIQSLFTGKKINNTENRAALHTALRFQGSPSTQEEQEVQITHKKIAACVSQLHSGQWLGFTGKPITHVINIGIGGSDLGPRMVVDALKTFHQHIKVSFVANVDGADLMDVLSNHHPETTLFIIASKTFSTLETLSNAESAKQWITDHGCPRESLNQHFIATTTNHKAAQNFGIDEENIFPLWDWVGGRYSLWSAIGLPIAIAVGMDNFLHLLAGAHRMDQHYLHSPTNNNMPVIAALITFWYSQFWGTNSQAILPYAQRLQRLPAFLQQLDMESLGKSVTKDGEDLGHASGNIIWGTEGTNGQHSFHQLLHQGTEIIPVDFILVKEPMSTLKQQHQYLQACCISQSQALLKGKTLADAEREMRAEGLDESIIKNIAPHKVVKGNKPSNTLIIEALTPKNLGGLLAFYEHKVFTLGVLLDINPFDQWGVELGKQLSKPIIEALEQHCLSDQWDGSTSTLIQKLLK